MVKKKSASPAEDEDIIFEQSPLVLEEESPLNTSIHMHDYFGNFLK